MDVPADFAISADLDLSADDLGQIISEAFHDVNDVDGMGPAAWALVAKKVAEAIGVSLIEEDA